MVIGGNAIKQLKPESETSLIVIIDIRYIIVIEYYRTI